MRILSALKWLRAAALLGLLLLGALLSWTLLQYREALRNDQLASAIQTNVAETSALRDRYFLYRDEHVSDQWNAVSLACVRLLAQAEEQFSGLPEHQTVTELKRNLTERKQLFGRIVANTRLQQAGPGQALYQQLDKRLMSQLMVKATVFHDAAGSLRAASAQRADQAVRQLVLSISAGVLALVLTLVATLFLMGRRISQGLTALHAGARRVAGGEIDFRLDEQGSDEFAEVAQSINRMTQELQRVAEHRQAQAALLASEAQFRNYFELGLIGMATTSPSKGWLQVNDKLCQMLGYTRQELVSKTWAELTHADDIATDLAHFNRVVAGEIDGYSLEKRFIRKDGSTCHSRLSVRCLRDAQAQVDRFVALIEDITERKVINDVTRFLAQSSSTPGSDDFFRLLARYLAQALHADYICIDRLVDKQLSAQTLAVFVDGKFDDNLVYRLLDTPCGELVGQQVCVIPRGVRQRFPHDAALQQMQAEGYIGVTLWSASGKPIGLIAAISRQPIIHVELAESILKLVAVRAAGELERLAADISLQLAANVFTHAREGIMITDANATIVDVNDTFTQITGYSREEVVGQNPRILKSDRQTPQDFAAIWNALIDKGHWYGEVWNRRKNNEIYVAMQTISAVRDAGGTTRHYVALFTDVTVMKGYQQQLERIAHFDALTNLPNRVLLADRLQQAMLQSQRRDHTLAVAYLDLDGFKAVNDLHGHGTGDALLVEVSQRMKEALREGDTLARIGGDEFVAVLVDLEEPRDCEPVLERLLQAVSRPVALGRTLLRVSASIGVTLYPQDDADADADLLLRQADQAMYLAKQAGKNRYHFFDVDQTAAVQTRDESLEQIRRALTQDEFVLYYQPKVNLKTGQVIGAEALIRWQHPQRGLLLPGLFLPAIEGHAISVELGEWVIDTALTQIGAWRAAGLELTVSVNVGARQLQQDNFVARLAQALAAHPDVGPAQLELEILETSALEDMAQVSEQMRACLALGVGFALDDFGTGYSSLTYLKRLPAAWLKIDQSFVHDMLTDPDDLAIVQGVIGLAGTFHRNVIAEGVESAAHGALLLQLNCELAQGYGIARPMPASELPDWVSHWQTRPVWTA